MKIKTFIVIMIAAILVGAIFGAVITLVPQLTLSADPWVVMTVNAIAAVFAGVVLFCYAKFTRWIQRRDSHKS